MNDDLISRAAAIDILDAYQVMVENGEENPYGLARLRMSELPSVQPERKKGKWIDKGWNGDWQYQTDGRGRCWHEWQCSECNDITKGAKWDFCPNCGADMRGE